MNEQLASAPTAEQPELTEAVTEALEEIRQIDPELIEAIEAARETGKVDTQLQVDDHNAEKITPIYPSEDRGVELEVANLSNAPARGTTYRGPGLLEVRATDWVKDEDDSNGLPRSTSVTGILRITEDGKMHTGVSYRDRTGSLVSEGAGNPQVIRARAIQAAKEIVEQSRTEGATAQNQES